MLDLSNNDFTGPIPPSLGNLTQLELLDHSQNKLLGVIPENLAAQFSFLAFSNVSDNLLSAHIPQGPRKFSHGNLGTLWIPDFPLFKHCGTVQLTPDENKDDFDKVSGFDWLFILVGLIIGLVFGFVMGDILTDRYP